MESWMTRMINRQARGDLNTNPGGLDDGGLSISGGLYNIMSTEPAGSHPYKRKKRHGIHKKVKPNACEHPGEQEIVKMHQV